MLLMQCNAMKMEAESSLYPLSNDNQPHWIYCTVHMNNVSTKLCHTMTVQIRTTLPNTQAKDGTAVVM
jgi:hypothetical protein